MCGDGTAIHDSLFMHVRCRETMAVAAINSASILYQQRRATAVEIAVDHVVEG